MNLNIIEPNYFKDFHCIGGECKNNCCHNWTIQLTKKEYINTKNVKKSKELQEICEHAFHRLKKSESPGIYAEMRLNEDGNCQFLDSDGLCMLQKECGYKILSQTCKQFPRKNFIYLTSGEQYLSTGCEEVVRMLMNMPNGIELTNGGKIELNDFMPVSLAITTPADAARIPYKYYWDIKTLIISIMKNRNYSVEDRLILLGIAFKRIDDLITSDSGDKIPAYIDGLTAVCADDKSMLDEIKTIEPKTNFKALAYADILHNIPKQSPMPIEFREKIMSAYGFNYTIPDDGKNVSITAKSAWIERQLGYLFNMLSGREYIIENFMLNAMLQFNLPFCDDTLTFWDSYIFICQVYSTMIFTLAGNLDESSDDKDIIDAFVIFSRTLFHSKHLKQTLINEIKKNRFTSLGSMVYLIKF
ncbi:MAG: flagellin lysine-N-methylase [Ruminococcus sp.]|nr:flagellin lysine-N-methylase [Ruminococcus sp.]